MIGDLLPFWHPRLVSQTASACKLVAFRMGYGKVSRWAGFSWFILWHVDRVGRTDYADGTDGLALKRERGRDAQNSKKIDLENC